MSTRLRLVLPRWGDNQLDAFDGMNFDFSALLNICFRCLANRGPNLSVDLDLTDGKRPNRLYDNALRADQRVDIGFFGAGLELSTKILRVKTKRQMDTTKKIITCSATGASKSAVRSAMSAPPANQIVVRPAVAASMSKKISASASQNTIILTDIPNIIIESPFS